MQVDRRTTVEVETTRCMRNDKPYRNKDMKAEAKAQAFKKNGTMLSYVPRTNHETCSCGKKPVDQCGKDAASRRNRVKRLRNQSHTF